MELRDILKYDCKADKLSKLSKEELFEIEGKLKSITPRWINIQMKGKSYFELKNVNHKIRRIKKKVRKALYECGYCAEAKFKIMVDKTGDEREYMIRDCGREECPYKDFFKENAISKTDKALKKMLKEIGK